MSAPLYDAAFRARLLRQGLSTDEMAQFVEAVEARILRYEEALRQIADHPVVSVSRIPEDNCDWHCAVTLTATAKDALGDES